LNLDIEILKKQSMHELNEIDNLRSLEEFKIKYLGKKGVIRTLLKDLASYSKDEKVI